MNQSTKDAHEQFVSGHSGSSIIEVEYVVQMGAILQFINVVTFPLFNILMKNKLIIWYSYLCTFIIVNCGIILCTTLLVEHLYSFTFFVVMVFTSFIIILETTIKPEDATKKPNVTAALAYDKGMKSLYFNLLTSFRSLVNISSCICILAVDFKVFPRRFCKTEVYGTSLMDVGVGCYVMCNAVVSPISDPKKLVELLNDKRRAMLKALSSSSTLLIVGSIRLLAVRLSNYQEHESEYGSHWNFFFTLASVKILSTFIVCMSNKSWTMSLIAMISYQALLSFTSLQNFILNGYNGEGGRSGIIEANREGIFSIIGYLFIFFTGAKIGKYITVMRFSTVKYRAVLRRLFIVQGVGTLIYIVMPETSRRLANLPYCLWVMSLCLRLLIIMLCMHLLLLRLRKRYPLLRETS